MEEKINEIIESVLELDSGTISGGSVLKDIPEWDSMMSVLILSEMREQLGISVPFDEALEIEKVSDLYRYV